MPQYKGCSAYVGTYTRHFGASHGCWQPLDTGVKLSESVLASKRTTKQNEVNGWRPEQYEQKTKASEIGIA